LILRFHRFVVSALAVVAIFGSMSAVEAGSTCLWRVRSDTTTMYLLGSVHLMKSDAYPLPVVIETAFQASSRAVFEVDLGAEGTAEAALGALAAGMLPEGRTLRETVSGDTWRLVEQHAESSGLDAGSLQRMRPWMVATTLALTELQRAGYSPLDGVDRHFYRRAVEAGTPVEGLETVEFQLQLMADLTPEQDEAFLRQTVSELETVIPMVDEIVALWRAGRAGEVAALLAEGYRDHPQLFERLVSDRNAGWMPRLEELLEGPGPVFVVVGALHLVGDGGVIERLRSEGYSVEQL
jgi:uncharacterized protein YbaP (TraB family)